VKPSRNLSERGEIACGAGCADEQPRVNRLALLLEIRACKLERPGGVRFHIERQQSLLAQVRPLPSPTRKAQQIGDLRLGDVQPSRIQQELLNARTARQQSNRWRRQIHNREGSTQIASRDQQVAQGRANTFIEGLSGKSSAK